MSGSAAVRVNNAGPYKWDGVEWHFWSLAPAFNITHLETIRGMPRTFCWLWNAERKTMLRAAVHPASPYVNAVASSVDLTGRGK